MFLPGLRFNYSIALSFVLGVLPLLLLTGAGAAARVSLGFTVFGGMVAASILGPSLVSIFYFGVQHLCEKFGGSLKLGISDEVQ